MRRISSSLTTEVVLAWMLVLVICSGVVGGISYTLYRDMLLTTRAEEAVNVAKSTVMHIDGDRFDEIMKSGEKNDYWYELKAYADLASAEFETAYLYIMDNDYGEMATYFAEGMPVHDPSYEPYDLGDPEVAEGVFADEMFEAIRTGNATITEPYPSEGYGDMVSGFAPIKNKSGDVVGVVGVDFFYGHVSERINSFLITVVLVIVGFLVVSYFLMTYLGTKLAGKPLADLDKAAQMLAVGDMDIKLNIRSSSEIGRLANSFTLMVDAIKEQVTALEALSKGDLTTHVMPRSDKDTMGLAIARIISNLNDMIGEIDRSAIQVSAGVHQVLKNSQVMAQGRSEQSNAIEDISGRIAGAAQKTETSLEVATKTDALTKEIKSEAQIGSEYMDKMTLAVRNISDASVAIGKVIKVIDDIAFQTNILALNAAVEAARAGQHGKGFAVVAEEVRNLASKSATAAKDTEQLISDSVEKAKYGADIADKTGASLNKIIQGVNECADFVHDILGAHDEQIETMMQIRESIKQVSNMVQQNKAIAEESTAVSEKMSAQADTLEEMVASFKLKGEELGGPAPLKGLPQ